MKLIETVYAQSLGGRLGEGGGMGVFGGRDFGQTGSLAVEALGKIVSAIIGFMTLAAGIWMLFQITTAGIAWISGGGDKGKLESARNRLTNAIIGLVIVVSGWAILALAGQFLGFDNILLNNFDIIETLSP
jgi:hypothetical protein